MRYEDLEDDIKDGLQRFDRRMLFVSLVLFSLIALGFFYYDFSRHADSADVITNMIESKARNNKKEALMMLAAAKAENSFAGVALFDQQGKRYFHLPADRNPDFFKNRSLLDRIFNISIERNYYFSDERESAPAGRIVFIYNTLPTWIAISIGLLAIFFLFYRPGKNQLKNFILEKLRAVHENTKVKDIAGQVRHDWKSVKQGILAIAETSKGLEGDERETLVMAINRMDGLLNDFSTKDKVNDDLVEYDNARQGYIHIASELDQVVREMRISSRLSSCREIQFDVKEGSLACYADISSTTFKRVISNLIKNAVEAIDLKEQESSTSFQGKVAVILSVEDSSAVINITDNGPGISDELIPKLGKSKITTKPSGEGRGILFAKRTLSEMGGGIKISSTGDEGTSVICQIPLPEDASWATSYIDFRGINKVGILDDKQTDLEAAKRLFMSNQAVTIKTFETPRRLLDWAASNSRATDICLFIDYDLGDEQEDGISILKKLTSFNRTYLLSNRYDDQKVQRSASELSLKVIPKSSLHRYSLLL